VSFSRQRIVFVVIESAILLSRAPARFATYRTRTFESVGKNVSLQAAQQQTPRANKEIGAIPEYVSVGRRDGQTGQVDDNCYDADDCAAPEQISFHR
jgi:hypothetical protein